MKNFTKLDIAESNNMIGGFSSVYSMNDYYEEQIGANNCKGGNCSAATCKNQKSKKAKGSNSNCIGNCVIGCGNKK